MTSPSLTHLNSFGVEASCDELVEFSNVEELQTWLKESTRPPQDIMVLGGGSNLLLVEHLRKTVIRANFEYMSYEPHSTGVIARIGAGVNWHHLVLDSLSKGYSGLENLSLIPGNVGAAPIQNIGAYGVELKDRFIQLTALDIETGVKVIFDKEACQFGYRDSYFKNVGKGRYVIVEVVLQLDTEFQPVVSYGPLKALTESSEQLTAKAVSDEVIRIRSSKLPDPRQLGNSGSFFKNPVVSEAVYKDLQRESPDLVAYPLDSKQYKLAAGWLIEQAGLKGYRDGDAGVHKHQALVLVNYGKASGAEVLKVAAYVQEQVYSRFKVLLESEVWILPVSHRLKQSVNVT